MEVKVILVYLEECKRGNNLKQSEENVTKKLPAKRKSDETMVCPTDKRMSVTSLELYENKDTITQSRTRRCPGER